MKSLTGKFSSARGWALLLILFLGAGLVVAACGDEEVPTPTTPAPPPPAPPPDPEPPPAPEPPATPGGLRISASGADFIEWAWTPVNDVSGYDVQYSANEAFTDEDEVIARTAEEISYRREGLEPGTSGYLRVRSATGTGEERVTSGWSTHVTGMTDAPPPPPVAPATPTGFMVSETTQTSITWTWDAVTGAVGYVVQVSADEVFEDTDTVLFNGVPFTTGTSYTAADLDPETTLYARVAAGAGTPTEPLLSAFTTHVTGMTESAAPQAPPAPANLEVKTTGSNFIEWEWDEVEGAAGYHAQFSTSSSFSDPEDFFPAGMSNTSQRVSNLEPESDGYLRVRAYTGTLADPVYGEWSESDKGTTAEPPPPPPAEPLEAPQNVGTSDRQDNSITVTWDDVDDAEEYEVQQRSNGGSWGDANCGSETGGNVVTVEECVASGLDERTTYDFRVKAFPDSGDTTLTESEWSNTASAETTGVDAPPPVTGGDDALNALWMSNGSSITWNWDPVLNRADRERIDHLVQIVNDDARCADITQVPAAGTTNTFTYTAGDAAAGGSVGWQNIGKNISTTYGDSNNAVPMGTVATLCVVRTWTDELANGLTVQRYGTPEVVTASTAPAAPTSASGSPANNTVERKTTALSWTFAVDKGLEYEVRLLADSRNVTGILDTKDSCDAGDTRQSPAVSSTDDVTVTHRESSSLKPYYQYGLCVRAKNGQGESDWAVAAARQITLPGKPSTPRYQPPPVSQLDSHASGSQIVESLVWSVGETDGTPRSSDDYAYTIVISEESSVRSADVDDVCELAADASTGDGKYTDITGGSESGDGRSAMDASAGIEVSVTDRSTSTDAADLIGTVGAGDPDEYYFFACVRAEPDAAAGRTDTGDDDHGQWAISSGQRFSRRLSTPSSVRVSRVTEDTSFDATVDWNAVNGADAYVVQSRTRTRERERTRSSSTANWGSYGPWGDWTSDWTTAGGTWANVSACTTSGCSVVSSGTYDRVSEPAGATTQTQTDIQTEVRVRATVTVGGSTVTSLWSSGRDVSHTKP